MVYRKCHYIYYGIGIFIARQYNPQHPDETCIARSRINITMFIERVHNVAANVCLLGLSNPLLQLTRLKTKEI